MSLARAGRRLAAGAAIACALAARAHAEPVTHARWLMGTLWTFTAEGRANAVDAALDTVAALERCLSNWSPTSELARLNVVGAAAASEPLFAVLDSARALAEATGGAFDPTVEALTLAWDLRGSGRTPSTRELADARSRVGWRHLSLDVEHARVELAGTKLDLGGIAKGFALDRAAAVLRAAGIGTASLDAGGQRLLLGATPCSVWVAHPELRDEPAVCLLLPAGSLSTSAQSEHAVSSGGKRLGHVLDPATGRPVPTRASVSVFTPGATRADAFSTALLVMGRDRARAFTTSHPGLGVLWLEPKGSRVDAEVWNLDVAATAPFVSLVPPHPTTAPRNTNQP